MVFREVTLNEDVDNVGLNLTNILDYEQLNSTDTLLNKRSGMYSSKLTLLDVYNKHYEIFEHDYLKEFPNEIHVR